VIRACGTQVRVLGRDGPLLLVVGLMWGRRVRIVVGPAQIERPDGTLVSPAIAARPPVASPTPVRLGLEGELPVAPVDPPTLPPPPPRRRSADDTEAPPPPEALDPDRQTRLGDSVPVDATQLGRKLVLTIGGAARSTDFFEPEREPDDADALNFDRGVLSGNAVLGPDRRTLGRAGEPVDLLVERALRRAENDARSTRSGSRSALGPATGRRRRRRLPDRETADPPGWESAVRRHGEAALVLARAYEDEICRLAKRHAPEIPMPPATRRRRSDGPLRHVPGAPRAARPAVRRPSPSPSPPPPPPSSLDEIESAPSSPDASRPAPPPAPMSTPTPMPAASWIDDLEDAELQAWRSVLMEHDAPLYTELMVRRTRQLTPSVRQRFGALHRARMQADARHADAVAERELDAAWRRADLDGMSPEQRLVERVNQAATRRCYRAMRERMPFEEVWIAAAHALAQKK